MTNKQIKAIAFDMDGTFLTDDKHFNKLLFKKVLKTARERNIKMIVASGDPLDCLVRYFPEAKDQLTFVAENGAQVVDNSQEVFTRTLDNKLVEEVVDYLANTLHIHPMLSGIKSGYLPADAGSAFLEHMIFYYPHHELLKSFIPLPDDHFFQVSFLIDDEDVPPVLEGLQKKFGEQLVITPSGNGSMDITIPGVNKGWALKQILNDWQLDPDNLVTFGDGGNDVSMLQLAGHSYAMPNGNQLVKKTAKKMAIADSNHDGVLKTIQKLI